MCQHDRVFRAATSLILMRYIQYTKPMLPLRYVRVSTSSNHVSFLLNSVRV